MTSALKPDKSISWSDLMSEIAMYGLRTHESIADKNYLE